MLGVARNEPQAAKADFESALTHSPDHPAAIIGLSNILLDVYSEKILPSATIPSTGTVKGASTTTASSAVPAGLEPLPSAPLGLGPPTATSKADADDEAEDSRSSYKDLQPPYKATQLPLVDRLAARERAFTLLSGLTRLGTGWDCSEAWFALARAHEESGQPAKAKEVLWWCVELEEAKGVRDWRCLGNGGYII